MKDRYWETEHARVVQRKGDTTGWPGKRTRTQMLAVQRREQQTPVSPDRVQDVADRGVVGASASLPHADTIQRSFGSHDVSHVRATVGGEGGEAAQAIGARAYATGDRVAFDGAPDLHTAAHEAAHVVQQRAGVMLSGGVGAEGDAYERHADAVADAVVAGGSAEALLDAMPGGGGDKGVQRAPADPATANATDATVNATNATADATTTAPAAVPGCPPEVLALAGTTIQGDGGFAYTVLADGSFRVVATPPSAAHAMGRNLRPDNEFATAWKTLADKIVADAKAKAPAAPAAPTPAAPAAEEPGLGTMILDGLTAVGDAILSPIAGLAASVSDFLFGGDTSTAPGQTPGQTPGQAPAGDPAAEAEKQRQELLDSGVKDNLDVAEDLKGSVDLGYDLETNTREGETAGQMNTRVRKAIISGDASNLDSLNCGQFTALTLAKAGWDLNSELPDAKTGIPIAYLDGGTTLTFVTMFMVVNTQTEATAALLDVQAGGATRVKAGSEEAKGYTLSKNNGKVPNPDGETPAATVAPADRATDFWVSSKTTFVGMKADAGHDFGAGAVAVALGGIDVALPDRKPGDLQQRLDTKSDGTYSGKGHSSTVHTVQGKGVCHVVPGDATSPKPVKEIASLTDGWYEGDFELGPDTAPSLVSSFQVAKVQLIDANYHTDGRDQAIGVGKMKDATAFDAAAASQVESSGRLPTSKWIAWKGNFPEAASKKPLP